MNLINRYDQIPYSFHPFPQSHPDQLATIAALFGLAFKPIENCRVLELGCGRGGNLLPMAEQLPGSQFLGVELSEVQAKEADELAKSSRLGNVTIRNVNILDVDESWGKFDYIITHGVYSWVPRNVQDKIIRICKENLSDDGLAYISYNVNPGWHMRGMLRDMMCYHAARFDSPKLQIQQARGVLDFVAKHASDQSPYGMFLNSEVNMLRSYGDEYLYHEHLSEFNYPIYFYEFAERCKTVGLEYVGESDVSSMYLGHFSAEVQKTLETVANDIIQLEQYLDFIRNRMFRQSIITHQGRSIDRQLRSERVSKLYLSTNLQPEGTLEELESDAPMKFIIGTDTNVSVRHPLTKASLLLLSQASPGYIVFDELVNKARRMVDRRSLVPVAQYNAENSELGRAMLQFLANGIVQCHSAPPPFISEVKGKFEVSSLAREMLKRGNVVTTLLHRQAVLNESETSVLSCLDRPMEIEEAQAVCEGGLRSLFMPLGDGAFEKEAPNLVNDTLSSLAKKGLLKPS